MRMLSKLFLTVALVVGLLLPAARPQPVYAATEMGYLWSLTFDFNNNYDGVLTIEVGPWENGELTEVYETSTAIVRCQPQGDASLNGGHLVLKGTGYLTCDLNLAQTVFDNHKMTVKPVDTYGSIFLRARALSTVNAPAPLFTHPDARYRLDFSATSSVGMEQSLLNGLGPQQTSFGGVTINTWNTYTFQYACIIAGPCPTTFRVGTQFQSNNLPGQWVNFATGPTTFEIGRDGGSYFVGRLDGLIIDPGNSAH